MASPLALSMDAITSALNPCSLETIQEPLKVGDDRDDKSSSSSYVWPLVLCCYQLDESIGRRRGKLDLFHVKVPDIASDKPVLPLQFGKPEEILLPEETSGILDGKWAHARGRRLFATAHASGEIKIHQLRKKMNDETIDAAAPECCFTLDFVARSELPSNTGGIPPLCISLNWATKTTTTTLAGLLENPSDSPLPIVSTYSNGKVAVHDVIFLENGGVSIVERDSWDAHNMFTNPAEVWSADFVGPEAVLSCGDEGKLKLWDARATNRPMHVMSPFDAGATCASAHPRHEYLVACGSYDETICLYDTRYLSVKAPVSRSRELGGGIWRIKWHPYLDERMLVAAMHGGCRVVEVDNLESLQGTPYDTEDEEPQFSFGVTKKFTEHQSMAYGADWLVCKHPTRNGFFEAAASCSFYDRAVFLWDTLP
uniref:methylated diphthine methylhydrolase n=1 Tax=Amphora coffeiformis TaxID=265554 RepID=A0A7S3L4B7_9STRA|eukprot:scaffold2767_cov177-Amphora_coffeaeformis.AAC.89